MIVLYLDNVISNYTPYTRFDHDLEKEKMRLAGNRSPVVSSFLSCFSRSSLSKTRAKILEPILLIATCNK